MHAIRPGLAAACFVSLRLLAPAAYAAPQQDDAGMARAPEREARQSLAGVVWDESRSVIAGASVTLTDAHGAQQVSVSDSEGHFTFPEVAEGTYKIHITADKFAPYDRSVRAAPGKRQLFTVTLHIAGRRDEVTVLSGNPLFRGAQYSGGSFVLSGEALESLPDTPGGLDAMLRALAVRTAGPFGPQILVNGFENNPVPMTRSIREIRINDNPFSAEYPKLGLGRIEILTKPGTEKFHGNSFFDFSDANLNTRNPF